MLPIPGLAQCGAIYDAATSTTQLVRLLAARCTMVTFNVHIRETRPRRGARRLMPFGVLERARRRTVKHHVALARHDAAYILQLEQP